MSNSAMSTVSEMLDKYGDFKASDIQFTSNRGAYYVKDKATRKIQGFPTLKGDEQSRHG